MKSQVSGYGLLFLTWIFIAWLSASLYYKDFIAQFDLHPLGLYWIINIPSLVCYFIFLCYLCLDWMVVTFDEEEESIKEEKEPEAKS